MQLQLGGGPKHDIAFSATLIKFSLHVWPIFKVRIIHVVCVDLNPLLLDYLLLLLWLLVDINCLLLRLLLLLLLLVGLLVKDNLLRLLLLLLLLLNLNLTLLLLFLPTLGGRRLRRRGRYIANDVSDLLRHLLLRHLLNLEV